MSAPAIFMPDHEPSNNFRTDDGKLVSAINGWLPGNCTIFSDLTGTVLHQNPGGFPELTRQLLKRYLDLGGTFVLVTGDSLSTVKDQFLLQLDYCGSQNIFLITEAGGSIDKVCKGDCINLFKGKAITPQTRALLLKIFEGLVKQTFPGSFEFQQDEIDLLLSQDGGRIDISPRLKVLNEVCWIDMTPSKATIFLPDSVEPHEQAKTLLEKLAHEPALEQLAKQEEAYLILNNNSFDFIRSRKEDGLERFLSIEQELTEKILAGNIISIGDAQNDEGLLTYRFSSTGQVLRLFVGNNDQFFSRISLPNRPNTEQDKMIYLKNSFVAIFPLLLTEIAA